MSAESSLIFFGVRYELQEEEVTAVEDRSDDRVRAARSGGLHHYFGRFGDRPGSLRLYIGRRIAVLGAEHQVEVALSPSELRELMEQTEIRLRQAGFEQPPALYAQWEPDL